MRPKERGRGERADEEGERRVEREPHWPWALVKLSVAPFPHLDGWVVTLYLPRSIEAVDVREAVRWVCEKLRFSPGKVVIVLSFESGRGPSGGRRPRREGEERGAA